MRQRIELVNARNKPVPPQPCNDIVAYPPPGLGITTLQTPDVSAFGLKTSLKCPEATVTFGSARMRADRID